MIFVNTYFERKCIDAELRREERKRKRKKIITISVKTNERRVTK